MGGMSPAKTIALAVLAGLLASLRDILNNRAEPSVMRSVGSREALAFRLSANIVYGLAIVSMCKAVGL